MKAPYFGSIRRGIMGCSLLTRTLYTLYRGWCKGWLVWNDPDLSHQVSSGWEWWKSSSTPLVGLWIQKFLALLLPPHPQQYSSSGEKIEGENHLASGPCPFQKIIGPLYLERHQMSQSLVLIRSVAHKLTFLNKAIPSQLSDLTGSEEPENMLLDLPHILHHFAITIL